MAPTEEFRLGRKSLYVWTKWMGVGTIIVKYNYELVFVTLRGMVKTYKILHGGEELPR